MENGQILHFSRKQGGIIRLKGIFFETFWANSSGGFEGSETFFFCQKITSISLHFPFHPLSSFLFLLSSFSSCLFFTLSSSLLFRPVSSLVLLILSSCPLSSSFDLFLSCLVFSFLLLSSLFLSCLVFSLCLSLFLSVSLCLCLSLSLCLSVSVSVWCGVWRVYRCYHMGAWCRYTRGRF